MESENFFTQFIKKKIKNKENIKLRIINNIASNEIMLWKESESKFLTTK